MHPSNRCLARMDSILQSAHHQQMQTGHVQHPTKKVRYLSKDACKTIMHSLVVLHLDYENSLLYGVLDCEIKKMQRV